LMAFADTVNKPVDKAIAPATNTMRSRDRNLTALGIA